MINQIKKVLESEGIDVAFAPNLPAALQQLFDSNVAQPPAAITENTPLTAAVLNKPVSEFTWPVIDVKLPKSGNWVGPVTKLPKDQRLFEKVAEILNQSPPTITENYGEHVSLDELKGHYKTHFLTPDQFAELIVEYARPKSEEKNNLPASTDQKSLNHIKREFFAGLKKISVCPVCEQKAKEYRRTIDNSLAWSLIALYKADKENPNQVYWHVNQLIKSFSSSGMAKLRFWGLVEEKEKTNLDKKTTKTTGYYKITQLGREFAEQRTTVQKYVCTYNNNLLGFDGPQINIIDALGTKFNYKELMKH